MTSADELADDFELAPPDKLSMHHRRQLSAMLDGELSPDEAKFMLRRLEHDSELAACWERWQVCGDVLRGRGHALLPADFSRRVAKALARGDGVEPELVVPPRRPRVALRGGRAALAASIAVMALLVARQLPDEAMPAADVPADLVAATPGPVAPANEVPNAPGQAPVPSFGQAASALAATAAVSELPRRASERRSRGLEQRAASRVQQRIAEQAAPVMVAASQGAPPALFVASAATADDRTGPFAPAAMAPPRPWPRAILPAHAGGSLSASYAGGAAAPSAFHPFEPRLLTREPVVPGADSDADMTPAPNDPAGAQTP
ncbi:MAG: sigma-E factor negative regulatory protein [Luteimonas sp.]